MGSQFEDQLGMRSSAVNPLGDSLRVNSPLRVATLWVSKVDPNPLGVSLRIAFVGVSKLSLHEIRFSAEFGLLIVTSRDPPSGPSVPCFADLDASSCMIIDSEFAASDLTVGTGVPLTEI
mgnify:CR=1 FL=1